MNLGLTLLIDIADILRAQNESFLTLAGKVAVLHEEVKIAKDKF